MNYTFTEHLHNYAVWTAARAVSRNFTDTKTIKIAIEKTGLKGLIDSKEVFTVDSFDCFHRESANSIINYLKSVDQKLIDKATYGRAAKIIAIYIKTISVVRDSGISNLSKIAHPPIDRILLTNAGKVYKDLGLNKINWTQLTENKYFELIKKFRTTDTKHAYGLSLNNSFGSQFLYKQIPNLELDNNVIATCEAASGSFKVALSNSL